MYLRHLNLADFRSYAAADVPLAPGVTTFLGLNGVGKTNLIEAVGYLSALSSHRVAQDTPLVRLGADHAVVRGLVVRQGRESLAELEINPGRMNRARLNRAPLTRARELLGVLRTVLFAPEDLALVKGDPSERRRFLDELLVQRQPRWAGVRADYDKILRQRNALLKSTGSARRRSRQGNPSTDRPVASELATGSEATGLPVWDDYLAGVGSQLLYARLRLLRDLGPFLTEAYAAVSSSGSDIVAEYRSSIRGPSAQRLSRGEVPTVEELRTALSETMRDLATAELERGYSLVGPHRDDVHLTLSGMPVKGYASHGESWSAALSLRLAAYRLLRRDLGEDPVLILDDVFAELDSHRRDQLADVVASCEQVLVTAAVADDVPDRLNGASYLVSQDSGSQLTELLHDAV